MIFKRGLIGTILTAIFLNTAVAQMSIHGKWKTIDDNSSEPRSIIEITEKAGKLYGRILKIFPKPNEDPDPICDKCDATDPRYRRKIINMEILQDLKKDGEEYSGGHILDPENGRVYRCKIWLEGEILKVRGYWGPFYRTQTWLRAQ